MNIRTVFDTRVSFKTAKYRTTILLLAASWHKYLRANTELEILHIGQLHPVYKDFFKELGIQCREVSLNINSEYAKTTNCIEAATPSDKRLLMVDNDVVFMNELSALQEVPQDHIAASYPGRFWVSEQQWDIIQNELKLPALKMNTTITPLKEYFAYEKDPSHVMQQSNIIYLNAGTLLIPPFLNLKPTWENHVKIIADHFKHHELSSRGVSTSCQGGLATAIATYKKFSWLPTSYNCRTICFVLGFNSAEDVKIMHLASGVGRVGDMESLYWINQYWKEKMYDRLETLRNKIDQKEFNRRKESMDKTKKRMFDLIEEYRLPFLI